MLTAEDDYTIQSNLSIPSQSVNASQHCFYIYVIDDNLMEEEEFVCFSLMALNMNDAVVEPSTFSFNITDIFNGKIVYLGLRYHW